MRLNSKGQITIPAPLRASHQLNPGDEVEIVEVDGTLQIRRVESQETAGQRLVRAMRGTATTTKSTDELMRLLRNDD